MDAQVAAEAVEVLSGGAAAAAHDLHVDGDAGLDPARHLEQLGRPALEHPAVERAAQDRVRARPEHDALGPDRVGRGDHGEQRDPPARRPLADALDGLDEGHVGQPRAEDHERGALRDERVEEPPGGVGLGHELRLALEEAHLEPQLPRVEPRDQDPARHPLSSPLAGGSAGSETPAGRRRGGSS